MTSLPPNVPERLENVPRFVEAYNICLKLEKSLQSIADKGGHAGNDLVYIRILGYLLHLVPGEQGLKAVVEEINSCSEDSALLAVGQMYYDHYIKAFRKNRGIEPILSNDMYHPAFETMADMINGTLLTAPQSDETAKTMALIRDGHRCVITGEYELFSVEKIRELEEKLLSDSSLRVGPTDCAYIFAPSAGGSAHMDPHKNDYSAIFWEIMQRFGHETLPDDLSGSKVHRLENVMTTCPGFHHFFDELYIWLAATKEENKYMLRASDPIVLRGFPEYVTFTTPDPARFPVPSPKYLAIHAACAEIAHLSGAAKCINKHYRDMEEQTTLDSDGASAELLAEAIRRIQIPAFETDARFT